MDWFDPGFFRILFVSKAIYKKKNKNCLSVLLPPRRKDAR